MIFCVKLLQRGKRKYRKMISVEEKVYEEESLNISSSTPYKAGTALEEGEWFSIQNASAQAYAIELIKQRQSTADFDTLQRNEFSYIDYLFAFDDDRVIFQNVSKTKLVSKKSILAFGEGFQYVKERKELTINNIPDAIYVWSTDTLFFRRLESITSIFHGIDMLYREATTEETRAFLANDFINLENGFEANKVKTANRKRIALAMKTIEKLDEESKTNIFSYICDYCPHLKRNENTFKVASENDLKMLLYGIEQRFYTTVVGNEKRIANSVVPLLRPTSNR